MEIWAYLDDSGHEDQATELFLSVGGASATRDIWEKVAQRWTSDLETAGLNAFHVRQFEHFRKTNRQKADHLIDKLIKTIDEFLIPVVAWGNINAYNAALRPPTNVPQQRRAHDFAVEFCFQRLISRVSNNDTVHIVFSKTPKYTGRVRKIYDAIKKKHPLGKRLGNITLDHTPQNDIHLQVADLVISGFIKGWKHNNITDQWYDKVCELVFLKYPNERSYFSFTDLTNWKSILDEH